MKKILSLILCTALMTSGLCACDSNDGETVSMENLPYGATMRQLVDTEIDICFDGRFFSDEEMKAVSTYFYAIQTEDVELFQSLQDTEYIKYNNKYLDTDYDGIIYSEKLSYASVLGENFEFTYIEAVECGDGADTTDLDDIKEFMNEIYKENGKETNFEETIKSAKYAKLNFIANSNGTTTTYDGQTVYIFTCTDGIYLF